MIDARDGSEVDVMQDSGLSKCIVAGGLLLITMAGGMMYFENKDVM